MPATLRPKRQLFREDIPHHRPLTGNTYYLHAGFPHPSRWHDGAQTIPPHKEPITHHHLHEKPGLHDDLHNNNNNNAHQNNNNFATHEHQHQLIQFPPSHQVHQDQHNHHQNVVYDPPEPVAISVVNSKTPHSMNIHSSIVHNSNGFGGGYGDNTLGNHVQQALVSPKDQANFDPLINSLLTNHVEQAISQGRNKPENQQKPHTEPDNYDDYGIGGGGGDYDTSGKDNYNNGPSPHSVILKQPDRKPKTIIHFHPVTVGNIINFNDDNKPVVVTPSPISYGPPGHVPGKVLDQQDVLLSMADPFIKSPFKSVNGPPEFLGFEKDNNLQYGPPQYVPGNPLGNLELAPMLPSYGPPIKPDTEPVPPPYDVALPVIAHLHSGPPPPHHHHPHPPQRHRPRGRGRHQHHLHLHHVHHPPSPVPGPFYDAPVVRHPPYVVHGQAPSKFLSFHNPRFRSHSQSQTHHLHHHKSIWSW